MILTQMRGVGILNQLKLFSSALASPIVSFINITKWQDPQLLFDIEVVVFGVGRFELRKHTDDLWHILPWRENELLSVIRTHLKEGDIFVDAGANIGIYTIVASKLVGASGRVISIEMMPDTASILRRHCDINNVRNVIVQEIALSDKTGDTITAKVPIGHYGKASIGEVKMIGDIRKIKVKTSTLDDLLSSFSNICLIKLDLEGVESIVLKNAEVVLDNTKNIIFESWSNDDTIKKLLRNKGFDISNIDNRNFIGHKR